MSFYIVDAAYPNGILGFACRLAEKFHQGGKNTCMLTTDASMAEQLDKQLWELEDAAFVPHQLWHEDVDAVSDNTVLLGWEEPPAQQHEVLINLQTEVPYCFSRFDRLIEIVDAGQPEPGRNRYQFYRDRGYPLETHKISA